GASCGHLGLHRGSESVNGSVVEVLRGGLRDGGGGHQLEFVDVVVAAAVHDVRFADRLAVAYQVAELLEETVIHSVRDVRSSERDGVSIASVRVLELE